MKISKRSRLAKVLASMLATTMAVTAVSGVGAAIAANDGKAAPAYGSQAATQEAARNLNVELTGEGSVLLKNENQTLPLNKDVNITVFGSGSQSLQGGTGTIDGALTDGGFKNVRATIVTEAVAKDADAVAAIPFETKATRLP